MCSFERFSVSGCESYGVARVGNSIGKNTQTQVACRNTVAMEEPQKVFDDQTIPDVEKFSLTYLIPDRVRWSEMTAKSKHAKPKCVQKR